jgi:hypothetical protein
MIKCGCETVICVSRPKSVSLSFLAEAQPRFENRRGQRQKALFGRGAHFLRDRANYKAKDIIVSTFFK